MDVLDREIAIGLKIALAETRRNEAQAVCDRIWEEIRDLRASFYVNDERTTLLPRFDSIRNPEHVGEFHQAHEDLCSLHEWAIATGSSLRVEIEHVKSAYDHIEDEGYRELDELIRAGCPGDKPVKSACDRIQECPVEPIPW